MVLVPLAFWVGRSWIETAIDRIGPEWNHLSKRQRGRAIEPGAGRLYLGRRDLAPPGRVSVAV